MQCGAASSDRDVMPGSADPICHDFIRRSTELFWGPWQLFKKTTQSVLWAIFFFFLQPLHIPLFPREGMEECSIFFFTQSNISFFLFFFHPSSVIHCFVFADPWSCHIPSWHTSARRRESASWLDWLGATRSCSYFLSNRIPAMALILCTLAQYQSFLDQHVSKERGQNWISSS